MPSFLQDISKFYGTGEKNAKGETLEEFLEDYNPYRYQTPSCTTDAVIFAHSGRLTAELADMKVLLVKRSNHPSIGYWALPGGFIDLKENLDDTARRELEEETGVKGITMEQIAAYGDYDRDPRARVITTAYMALVDEKDVRVQAGDDAADAVWCELSLEVRHEEDGGRKDDRRQEYILHIHNDSRRLDTEVVVEHTWTTGLIREEKYRVLEQGVIAVDHGAIITQALVILKRRLEE